MPWRLIGIIIVVALLLGFIGLNLENTCGLNFGFAEISDVPVYITIFASFLLGMLFSIPFFVSIMKKKHKKELHSVINENSTPLPKPAPNPKKSLKDRLFGKKKTQPSAESSNTGDQENETN